MLQLTNRSCSYWSNYYLYLYFYYIILLLYIGHRGPIGNRYIVGTFQPEPMKSQKTYKRKRGNKDSIVREKRDLSLILRC